MAFPNITDIVATTIEKRSGKITDNVTKNNAILAWLKKSGNIRYVTGGSTIFEEFNFAENGNFGWYSGYDQLPVAASDVISGATFPYKQCAVPITISGLEELQNSGDERIIDLLEGRIKTGESTMANNMSAGLYSDGTGTGGKQITGLQAAVPLDPTTGTYGSVDRSAWTFWRSQLQACGANPTAATIQGFMNTAWAKCVRGKDRPKLILFDANLWGVYMASLQAIQRFTDTDSAKLGFPSIKYMDADVVLDGGIGGFCPAWVGWFLNTDYLFYRPHKNRNMVPLNPKRRFALNQDAEVQILAWAGNMTTNGAQFQLYFKGS